MPCCPRYQCRTHSLPSEQECVMAERLGAGNGHGMRTRMAALRCFGAV